MAVAGALIGGALGSYGKKPKIPSFTEVSPDAVQKQTVGGNIASFADIAQLATSVNLFNQEQLDALIDRAIGKESRQQIQSNIALQLRGELPAGVLQNLRRSAAERGVASGTAGSGFQLGTELSSQLGMSLEMTQRGLNSAQQWLAQAAAPQFDVTSMFFTPQQRLNAATYERDKRFERDLMAAQIKAMPDPATAALGQEIDRMFNTFAQFGMAAAGAGIGGGGGGGGMTVKPTGGMSSAGYGPYNFPTWSLQGAVSGGSAGGKGLG